MNTIHLPNIQLLSLENFSLYPESPVKIDLSKPVSCLMGANGIGKSTMLNCINFAITGKINPPEKKIKSIDELFAGNSYSFQYFDGRISETDKDYASVTVSFLIDGNRIEVQRRFFPDGNIISYRLNEDKRDSSLYENDIVELSNLKKFSQFVFLQLKVLSFDEGRDCLFWNPSVLTPAIFLCLGQDIENANKADSLAREIQKLSSRIRNIQWDITKQGTRLTTLIEERKKVVGEDTQYDKEDEANSKNRYEEICKQLERKMADYNGFVEEQQLVYAKVTELTVKRIQLENEYKEIYSQLYSGAASLETHPLIAQLTTSGCPICHATHTQLPERIVQCLSEKVCPICGEPLLEESQDASEVLGLLQMKDEELTRISEELSERIKRQEFLKKIIDELSASIDALNSERGTIEQKKYSFLPHESDDSWTERIRALQDSISAVEHEKAENIKKRDVFKAEYEEICHKLENIYQKVQVHFLPIFKRYAKAFTGLDLDMELNSVSDDSRRLFRFILQIDDTNRDNEFELSESQRFFIDIALRMAIVCFCAEEENASMLIDTPEGSLDIAYETNAGSMFYDYISAKQKLIITANLNASGLTQTLAGMARSENFSLISMLRWAKLSSVQSEHMDLFENSIETIENKLEG